MTALTLELPFVQHHEGARGSGTAAAESGGGPTLDSVLSGMWEGLAAHHSVACPLCGGELRPDYEAHVRQPNGAGVGRMDGDRRRLDGDRRRLDGDRRRPGRVPEGGSCQSCRTRLT